MAAQNMAVQNPLSDPTVRLIEERAIGARIPEAFGSAEDTEKTGYESLLPSYARTVPPEENPKVHIGGPACRKPYDASVYNCSALSFGPLSKQFILAVNGAAYERGFYQNTGEAGISPYHFGKDVDIEAPDFDIDEFFECLHVEDRHAPLQAGAVVWQIGTGYFSCRTEDGRFDPERFRLRASISNVKMIELKLSQGVEPRREMPVMELSPGIARLMGVEGLHEAKLQPQHAHFDTPIKLMQFIGELRELAGGKPIGLKLGLTHRHWFLAMCKAMRQTGIKPDFITVDGMEAGTAAAFKSASGYTGTPLNEALVFVHNALVGANLRDDIRIIASGRVFTERDVVSKLARGADLCATARAMLVAAGCDQQRECHLGICLKGIATQDPRLAANFDVAANMERIANFHRITMQELNELLAIAGLTHVSQLGPAYVQRRVNALESRTLDELYEFLLPGALLTPFPWMIPNAFRHHWQRARADAPFSGNSNVFSLRR